MLAPRTLFGVVFLLTAMLLAGASLGPASRVSADHVEPVLETDNATCASLGFDMEVITEFKPQAEGGGDATTSGTYTDGTITIEITVDANGFVIDWESDLGVVAVIVKAGSNAHVYLYDPPEFADTGLQTPLTDPEDEESPQAGLSHLVFCYNEEEEPPQAVLNVVKTADATYTTTCTWEVDKEADDDSVTIAADGEATINYTVTYTRTCEDGDFVVSGTITITNDGPGDAEIASVEDVLSSGEEAEVDCDVTFPFTLSDAVGSNELVCTYEVETDSAAAGTNTATVTDTEELTYEDDAEYTFTQDDEIDECITVSDTYEGSNVTGELCESDSFEYERTVTGDGTCTAEEVENTADFTTNDTETTGDDTETVTLEKVCVTIDKTANAEALRTCTWDVEKTGDEQVFVPDGGTATIAYTITVTAECVDEDPTISGTITVTNTGTVPITIVVTDIFDDTVTCPDTSLDPGDDVECSYSGDLPNTDPGENTAEVTATGDGVEVTDDVTVEYTVVFDTEGECADLSDELTGFEEEVCLEDLDENGEATFETSYEVDIDDCGETIENVVELESETGNDSDTVETDVACLGRTMGFWGNQNGVARVIAEGGYAANPVSIGRGTNIDTQAEALKVLPNTKNACGKAGVDIYDVGNTNCTTDNGLNVNALNTLAAQTLALSYNIEFVDNYAGQTVADLGCGSFINATLTGFGLSSASTVEQVRDAAVALLDDSASGGDVVTTTQLGAFNDIIGSCLNRES